MDGAKEENKREEQLLQGRCLTSQRGLSICHWPSFPLQQATTLDSVTAPTLTFSESVSRALPCRGRRSYNKINLTMPVHCAFHFECCTANLFVL